MEFLEKEYAPAKVVINYEELEGELKEKLADYENLVVTDDTLPDAKTAKRELSGMRTTIDSYRKEKKKELEAPIKAFEEQCKKLIAMVREAEQPLDSAIAVYDNLKREEKRAVADKLIWDTIAEFGLYGEHAAGLTILDKYLNLTATKKAVAEDIRARAMLLKQEQSSQEERLSIIKTVIESENARIRTKLSIEDFNYMISNGADTSAIISEIKRRAEKIYESENRPEEPVAPAPVEKEPEKAAVSEQEEPEYYTATFKLTGTYEELKKVSNFLKSNGISYEVLEQYKL